MNFLKQAIHDLISEDGLVVMPRECGCIELLSCFIKYYIKTCQQSGKLVFILNAENYKDIISCELKRKHVQESQFPLEINSKFGNVKDRQELYRKGGVYYISSLILQLDFLQNHIPYKQIDGLLVYDCHKFHPDSVYLFCVLLFRHYCQGFVKCFSDNAIDCCKAFPQVSSFLNELTVSGLFLYPRYRDIVVDTFNQYPITIENVKPQYSEWMETVMTCIEAITNHLIKEIQLLPCDLNEVLSIDFVMQPSVSSIIKKDLKEHGSAYSSKTRDLLHELITMNKLALCLNSLTIIELYSLLQSTLRDVRGEKNNGCYWIQCSEADQLYQTVHNEIFQVIDSKKDHSTWLQSPIKWSEMSRILSQLNQQTSLESQEIVLVNVLNRTTLVEVYNYLLNPSLYMLLSLQKRLKQIIQTQNLPQQSKERKLAHYLEHQIQSINPAQIQIWREQSISYQEVTDYFNTNRNCILCQSPFYPQLKIYLSACYFSNTLLNPYYSITPTTVIMVDATYPSIRQAEVFNVKSKDHFNSFYVLLYEQYELTQYLQDLQAENNAFKKLIKERDQFIQFNKWKEIHQTEDSSNSTKSALATKNLIIVDSREFKSSLPPALYKANYFLLPFTLEICDYVLAPMIGVERKAFNDLVNSLKHGRLQKQMERMCRVYRYPVLLIESFSNELFGGLSSIVARLCVLIRCYPQMRILWSFSEQNSVNMFQMIKRGKSQPSLEEVMCLKDEPILNGNKQDMAMIDTLVTFPGVDLDSAYALLRKINKVSDICSWNKRQFEECMTPSNAELLYTFLHSPFQ